MSVDVGSAKGYLDLDISGFLSGLKTAQSEANSMSNNIEKTLSKNLASTGKTLTSAGKTLTKTVTLPIAGAGTAVVSMSTKFESAMSKVKAISGATGKDFEDLSKKAQELGATTAFSASEVADGMTEMAKAGWNSQQIMAGMEGVLNAASASGENLATVSTIVADAITGFGLKAEDATRVADLLTQAANAGTIDINDLGESFKYVAPVASAMGFSIEDVTTAISAMSMAGIKGSQAGTSLRTMLARLAKPTGAVKKAMDELDLSISNSDGSFKSLDQIVAELRGKFSGMTDDQKAYYATVLAGQEGMSGLLALLNLTQEEYDEIAKSMDNANGVAKETAEVMLDNLSGQVTILKSALEGLAIQFGEVLLPYLKKFVQWVQNLVVKLQELSPEQKDQIVKWAAFAAAIGPVLLIVGKLITVISSLIAMFSKTKTFLVGVSEAMTLAKAGFPALGAEASKLGVLLGGITAPIMGIIIAIGALIGAFVSLWKNNEEFRNKVIAIWNEIKETFNNFTQGIVDRLNALGFDFESITDVIKSIWEGFCNFLAPIFIGVFQTISNAFKTVTNLILNVADFFIAIFKGDWKAAWEAVKNIFKTIWDGIKSFLSNILNVIKGIFNAVLGWFGTSWKECWNSIKTFFMNIWNGIKSWFSNTLNSIKSTASNAWNSIKSTTTSVWNGIMSAIKSPIEKARDIVKSAIDKIKGFFNFKVSWPRIPLPHFSIKPSGWSIGDLLKGKIPSLRISWYKKAMNNPMIMSKPTIFGYDPSTGKLLGGGESGSELITGVDTLMRMIRKAISDVINPFMNITYSLAKASSELGYITYDGFAKQKQILESIILSKGNGSDGDTFIFNSPKPIDEIEAAKQFKKTKRELAEGF